MTHFSHDVTNYAESKCPLGQESTVANSKKNKTKKTHIPRASKLESSKDLKIFKKSTVTLKQVTRTIRIFHSKFLTARISNCFISPNTNSVPLPELLSHTSSPPKLTSLYITVPRHEKSRPIITRHPDPTRLMPPNITSSTILSGRNRTSLLSPIEPKRMTDEPHQAKTKPHSHTSEGETEGSSFWGVFGV
jgi:hypothetical protein